MDAEDTPGDALATHGVCAYECDTIATHGSTAAMNTIDFELRGEFITLDRLLKATGLADSGGAAKALVAAGRVQVDGQQEWRKACKLRAGQVVAVPGARVRLRVADPAPR